MVLSGQWDFECSLPFSVSLFLKMAVFSSKMAVSWWHVMGKTTRKSLIKGKMCFSCWNCSWLCNSIQLMFILVVNQKGSDPMNNKQLRIWSCLIKQPKTWSRVALSWSSMKQGFGSPPETEVSPWQSECWILATRPPGKVASDEVLACQLCRN